MADEFDYRAALRRLVNEDAGIDGDGLGIVRAAVVNAALRHVEDHAAVLRAVGETVDALREDELAFYVHGDEDAENVERLISAESAIAV
jgi:hypothetical protein